MLGPLLECNHSAPILIEDSVIFCSVMRLIVIGIEKKVTDTNCEYESVLVSWASLLDVDRAIECRYLASGEPLDNCGA